MTRPRRSETANASERSYTATSPLSSRCIHIVADRYVVCSVRVSAFARAPPPPTPVGAPSVSRPCGVRTTSYAWTPLKPRSK